MSVVVTQSRTLEGVTYGSVSVVLGLSEVEKLLREMHNREVEYDSATQEALQDEF